MEALARVVGTVPSHDHSIELRNLLLEAKQLSAKRGNARSGNPFPKAARLSWTDHLRARIVLT